MIYVLDTDILSLLAHADSPHAPRIRRRIAEIPADDSIVTTVINYEEQIRGWMAALSAARSAQSEIRVYGRLLLHLAAYRRMSVLPFDHAASEIVKGLREQRLKVGAMDLKIASIVLAVDGCLVTRNVADFQKVSGLQIEDWSIDDGYRP